MNDKLPDIGEGIEYHSETDTYRAAFDSQTTDPSVAVVEAIAQIEEKKPTEIEPLYRYVDPEALDRYLQTPATATRSNSRKAEFAVGEYTVTVLSCGLVKVQPTETADDILDE